MTGADFPVVWLNILKHRCSRPDTDSASVRISQLDNHCCNWPTGLLRSPTTASISRTHSQCQRWSFTLLPRRTADPVSSFLESLCRHCTKKGGGGASRDRTDDLKLAKLALSQLSYGPEPWRRGCVDFADITSSWWAEKELNLRPHAYQACALTT